MRFKKARGGIREKEARRYEGDGTAFAARLRGAKREAPYSGAVVANYFRKPYGPGWALIGDAGYNRDFITGQGIMDAFHHAELCVAALDRGFSGAQPFNVAMRE